MATSNITDKLVKQLSTSVAVAQPVKANQFLPEIPSANVDIGLPIEVINSLNTTQSVSKTVINNERRRVDTTADAIKESNKEIDIANRKIQEIDGSVLLQFQGMFDADYSYQAQEGRIKNAKRKLARTEQTLNIERQREALDLKEANLPLDMFKTVIGLQSQKANLSAVQANAIIQSNAARKQMRTILQGSTTDEEIMQMQKTGEYTDIWQAQDVTKYLNDKKEFQLNMETKQLANASGRVKLANELEAKALSDLPISWAQTLLSTAEKDKTGLIKIPGTTTTVTVAKLQSSMATKQKQQQDAFVSTAETQLKLVKNDAEWTSMIDNVSNVSSIFSGDGSNLTNMRNLNLLNITDEVLVDFPFDSLHPAVRGDFQTMLQAASVLNEKSNPVLDAQGREIAPAVGVTTQDVFTFKQIVLDLKAKTAKVETAMIEASPKATKPAMKEWFANRQMQTQDNSAAMLVANSISLPNLVNDQALSASFQVLMENVARDVLGDAESLDDLSEEELSKKVFASLLQDNFSGKIGSRDKIIKALAAENSNGDTPVEVYANNRVWEITRLSMKKLAEQYPEYRDYFNALDRDTGFKNTASLAGSLAELSFRVKQKDDTKPDMFLNQALLDNMNGLIESQKVQWDSQLNPVRGSLMNLMFNTSPSIYIDNNINTVFGTPSRNAWTTLTVSPTPLSEKFKGDERRALRTQQRTEDLQQGFPDVEPNVFGKTPLPVSLN